jgi:hypothetical protein
MQVRAGQIVATRDGRRIYVTDAADAGEDGQYHWWGHDKDGNDIIRASMPAETIFVGYPLDPKTFVGSGSSIVSDMSEVAWIVA